MRKQMQKRESKNGYNIKLYGNIYREFEKPYWYY